jgi:nucleoside triphosphate pyrophosphatase
VIVLASGSPRRRQLLEMLGLPFRVVAPQVDETRGPAEQPEGYVTRLAREKATTVAARERGAVVLAADTTVVLRGRIFEKPASAEEAAEMLRQLEGRQHQVMTAVAVAQDGRVEHALDVTAVTFRPLSDAAIAAYVATGEPLDKAGAYAIQGKGAALVEGIRGDFFGVMGLPVRLALELLERFGVSYSFGKADTGSPAGRP